MMAAVAASVGGAKAEDWKPERGDEWENIALSLWRGADIALWNSIGSFLRR